MGFIEILRGGAVKYEFQITEPVKVIVSLSWRDEIETRYGLQLHMRIYDPTNKLIASDRSMQRPKVVVFDAKELGTYKVRVSSYYGNSHYKLDVLKPGEAVISNDNFFGRDSLWELDTTKLGNKEIEIIWSEINKRFTNLEVEIYTKDMQLQGVYRVGTYINKLSIPPLPEGKYILRIRQYVEGDITLMMNERLTPIRIEDSFFAKTIRTGSIHRYKVNITKTQTSLPNIDYFMLIWNKILDKTTPELEMKLLKKNPDGTEIPVMISQRITSGQSILRLSEVTSGEYILQIRAFGSGDEPARYAIGQLEDQLKPLTFTSFTIKQTLNQTKRENVHTIISKRNGTFNVSIMPKDLIKAKNSTYNVQVLHQNTVLVDQKKCVN